MPGWGTKIPHTLYIVAKKKKEEEVHNLRPLPRPTKSESAFQQNKNSSPHQLCGFGQATKPLCVSAFSSAEMRTADSP